LHAAGLKPKKQRRFFPEGIKVNIDSKVILCDQHFSANLSKIDFVPIK